MRSSFSRAPFVIAWWNNDTRSPILLFLSKGIRAKGSKGFIILLLKQYYILNMFIKKSREINKCFLLDGTVGNYTGKQTIVDATIHLLM